MAVDRFDVELSEGAEHDLETIHDYVLTTRSAEEADDLLDAFLEKIATLERFPMRGNVPKELEALGVRDFRQTLVAPYRLIYQVTAGKVIILLVADGRRDMQRLLEGRLLGR